MVERTLKLARPLRGVTPFDAVAATPSQVEANQQGEELQRLLHSLREAAKGQRLRYQQMLGEMEKGAVELGLALARHFLLEHVQTGQFPFEALARRAVAHLASRQPVTLHLHPLDLALLEKRLPEEATAAEAEFCLAADARLPRGACRIEASELTARFDLEQQLGDLRQQLLDSVSRPATEV